MNDQRRYGAVAKTFHWLTVALFIATFWIAWSMVDLPLGPEKFELYNLHKSIGVSILALTVLRLIWRWISPPPALPTDMSATAQNLARLGHGALYVAIFVQIAVGLGHSWAANFPVVVFGLFTLPSLVPPDEALKKALTMVHFWGGWVILALIAGHIGAALYHHFVRKDAVMRRMLPWVRV